MNIIKIIEKKRDGKKLAKGEIEFFVDGYTHGSTVLDYQASALLMAIFLNGMDDEELGYLTAAMINTGDVLDFSKESGVFVDKHSTGGVGDKTSLVLGPILAACGLKLAKMSGRGLGFTGGTLDKMEAIPNMRVEIDESAFFKQVREIGIAIVGQSKNMVPADKKFYALRDVTGTVESIPLMASSIMSKKLAAGAEIILLDVKFGDGAFMKDLESATELATRMIAIGEKLGKKVFAEITSMQDVLGRMVGNALEIKEVIDSLKGNFEPDFKELCLHSAATLLKAGGIVKTDDEANAMFEQVIADGSALKKLGEMIHAQGGDNRVTSDESLLSISKNVVDVTADSDGYISYVHTMDVGILSAEMGAGRLTLDDKIDYSVGIEVLKKLGDEVRKGDVICKLYHNSAPEKVAEFVAKAKKSFVISAEHVKKPPLIAKTL
ncbi:MAG: thymidine phosphorylase [Bifidobacteriaceae bacterium]|nr:thymidine phosphorylase [Bifidobacteriaceae bacterium]